MYSLRVFQAGIAIEIKTVRYILISFYVSLNKHLGSMITRLAFDFHRLKATQTIFLY